ncbi:general substrate transporter [Aspergillus karnatakaensis]|uniref:general substrate transporter n=1 Tax=Aspergillus karnatakaensis TaxID=1810916 RepID=UPI003CCD9B93
MTRFNQKTPDFEKKGQGVSGYEALTPWQTVLKFKRNALICFMVTLSAGADGYQIAMLGNIIANRGFVNQFGTKVNSAGETYLASPILSAWNAIGCVGQIIGMTTLPFLSDRLRRKAAMFYYLFILAISVMIESISDNWKSVGCLQSTIPTYISEVAPIRIRGALLMCYSLWFITGQFFAPVALQVCTEKDPYDYKTPIYTQWSQIGLMLIIYLWIPESPAWCASRGKESHEKAALKRFGISEIEIDHQYDLLVMNVEYEREVAVQQKREHWHAIFRGSDGLRTLIFLWTLMAQQFIGLGIFFGYVAYFFQQAGLDDPFKTTCIVSGINIAFSILVIYLADVIGRRWLSCSGTTLCWVCTVAVGILGVAPKVGATNHLLVFFTCIWNIGLTANSATGWGFVGEISSQRLRPYTAGFAAASTCVVGIGLGVLIPYMINANQWNWNLKTSWFFSGLGLPFVIAMWFSIPETAGRSAAELDELFERKIKPWRFHKTKTITQQMVAAAQAGGANAERDASQGV